MALFPRNHTVISTSRISKTNVLRIFNGFNFLHRCTQLLACVHNVLFHFSAAIATCRYLGTFRPFLYATWATKKMISCICVSIVAYSAIIPTWMALWYHRYSRRGMCALFTLLPTWGTVFLSCHTYVLMAAVGFVYQRILREALRIKRQINASVPESAESNATNASEADTDATRLRDNLNVIKNFAIIVGTSFLVWLPHAMLSMFLCYQPLKSLRQGGVAISIGVMALAAALIPVLNPIIYATRLKWFRVLMRYVIGFISYRECEQSMSDIWFMVSEARLTKAYDVTIQRYRNSHATNRRQQNPYFTVYGFKILCEISKGPFEISHKLWNTYTGKYTFYGVLKIWRLMIS